MLLRLVNVGDWVMFADLDDENAFKQHSLDRLHLLNVSKSNQGRCSC